MSNPTFVDLRAAPQPVRTTPYDYCVVGGGALGLYVAAKLARAGAAVAVIERGGTRAGPPPSDEEIEFPGVRYSAATEGRNCGLGGTTARWGGLLVPHIDADRRGSPEWDHIVACVQQRSATVLASLGWNHANDEDAHWIGNPKLGDLARLRGSTIPIRSLYLPFRRKDLRWLIHGLRVDVLLHAVAAQWRIRRSGPAAVDSIVIRAPTGSERVVSAGRFIIAAGAIESTRCALEIASSLPGGCLASEPMIGTGLSDHLSVPIGSFEGGAGDWALRNLGLWWERGWMRGCRFVGEDQSRFPARSFMHPVFHYSGPGFRVLREVLRAIQGRRVPKLRPEECLYAAPALTLYALERVRNRAHYERGTRCVMQLDVEQATNMESRIALVHAKRDWSGRAPVRVNWEISSVDRKRIAHSAATYREAWAATPGLPEWTPLEDPVSQQRPHDAYHPVGTCRMGLDDGVVDGNLRLRGLSNVWIASTAVLPSAGSANPTFTALCLADAAVQSMVASQY
jgi:choline dehydrogenase-like flavoprotein